MNRYGHIAGFHNPKETQRLLALFNDKTNKTFVDNSWKNDEVDSIHCELSFIEDVEHKYIEVFFPSEEYPDFFVTNEDSEELLLSTDIEKVIEFINSYKN